MTNLEKIKFLRAEGWKTFGLGRAWHMDPKKRIGRETDSAYNIAKRRKYARDYRRLITSIHNSP